MAGLVKEKAVCLGPDSPLVRSFPLVPVGKSQEKQRFTHIDWVASSIVQISTNTCSCTHLNSKGKTAEDFKTGDNIFHLVNTNYVTLDTLVKCLIDTGFKITILGRKEFQERCKDIGPDHPWYGYCSFRWTALTFLFFIGSYSKA